MIVLLAIIAVILVLMIALAIFVHKVAFGKRCDGNSKLKYFTEKDFKGLNAEAVEFTSNKGQKLRGKIYTHEDVKNYKGLIIFVHGMGGGHLSYTTEINTLAKNGFMVLGYDNTGTFASEGKNTVGFFQAVLDLKSALKFVEENKKLNKYNVALVGHSWGAYSACQVLQFNPKVKAVVALSGLNDTSQVLCDSMSAQLKFNCNIFKWIFSLMKFIQFGKDAMKNTVDILKKTDVPVLVFQGDSDQTVLLKNSLVADYSNKVEVVVCKGRFHNVYQTKESEKYLNDTFAEIGKLSKNKKSSLEEIDALYKNIDFKKMTEEDEEVLNKIVSFIEKNIG